jgi:hypothetical protein
MSSTATRIRASIEAHGWHVIAVPEDEEGPGFAYSIGLHRSFDHPEVIVFGLPIDIMHGIVNTIGEQVRRGSRFGDGDVSGEVLEGLPARFQVVSQPRCGEFLGQAVNYYGGHGFPVLQCYWPDADGRFPGQPGCTDECAESQPSLQDGPSEGRDA